MLNYCYCDSHLTECAVELFGNNCYKNCSLTCGNPGVCHKVTGHCNGSCLPGWEGDMCQNGNNLPKKDYAYHIRIPFLTVIYCCFYFFYFLFVCLFVCFLNLKLSHDLDKHSLQCQQGYNQ